MSENHQSFIFHQGLLHGTSDRYRSMSTDLKGTVKKTKSLSFDIRLLNRRTDGILIKAISYIGLQGVTLSDKVAAGNL